MNPRCLVTERGVHCMDMQRRRPFSVGLHRPPSFTFTFFIGAASNHLLDRLCFVWEEGVSDEKGGEMLSRGCRRRPSVLSPGLRAVPRLAIASRNFTEPSTLRTVGSIATDIGHKQKTMEAPTRRARVASHGRRLRDERFARRRVRSSRGRWRRRSRPVRWRRARTYDRWWSHELRGGVCPPRRACGKRGCAGPTRRRCARTRSLPGQSIGSAIDRTARRPDRQSRQHGRSARPQGQAMPPSQQRDKYSSRGTARERATRTGVRAFRSGPAHRQPVRAVFVGLSTAVRHRGTSAVACCRGGSRLPVPPALHAVATACSCLSRRHTRWPKPAGRSPVVPTQAPLVAPVERVVGRPCR